MFFSFLSFNCYLFAGKWKEFSWDQPGSCQRLELKSFRGGDVRAEQGGCFPPSALRVPGSRPARLHGFNSPFFHWDVDKCPRELWWEEHGAGPRGCFFSSLLMGNRRWFGRDLAKRETFLSLPAWKKSILSHPCLTAEGGGLPNTAQEGLVGRRQRRQKVPSDFTRMEQPWATSFVWGVKPNLPPTAGQDPSHLLPKASRAWDAPAALTLKQGWGFLGSLCQV